MRIPDKVKIGYKDYTVKKVDNLDDGSQLLYGQIQYEDEAICLCNEYAENQLKCTLIHEIIHGIDDMNGIGLSEMQVEKLGKGLYQFIKDNQEMF